MTRALQYFFDEAVASLRRGFRTALMAVLTIAVAFLVLGGFLVLTVNMERAFARWQEAAEFSIYLDDRATQEQRDAIVKTVQTSGEVAAVDVVSKEQALARFKQSFGAIADAAAEMAANPLPASIEVRLRPGGDPSAAEALALQMAKAPGVTDVRYDRVWIERLMHTAGLVRTWGFALAALLVGAAALTVASVVRLAMVARRDEIHIMQLVGAPIAYIRGPFVMEGLIQGGLGATVALVGLWIVFGIVRRSAASGFGELGAAIDPASLAFLSAPMAVGLVVAGMGVGSIGGFIAARGTQEIRQ
jgi:cell division transport system permease protein